MKNGVVMLLCCLCLTSLSEAAGLYRWVDDSGKVHYSDSVPPEMSQKGHTELDQQGNHVNKVDAAKTDEQLKEEQWLAELEEKLAIKKARQQRKDQQLLNSYASVEQFDAFYAERFKALEDERAQLRLLHGKLNDELETLQKQHEQSPNAAAKQRVQAFIDTNRQNTQAYEEAIHLNEQEERNVRREAEELRKRYLYLLERLEKEKQAQAALKNKSQDE
ncbi:MAG: DUF4124 domain-containing protein [Thiolinea sp.]